MFNKKPKESETDNTLSQTDARLRVVRIIGDKEIIINGGTDRFIERGDLFRIYNYSKCSIEDPFSSENLGHLKIYKGEVRADSVMNKMALCQSNELVGLSKNNALRFFVEPLNINASDISVVVEQRERIVTIGDYLEIVPRD